jgi:hypothetical protein
MQSEQVLRAKIRDLMASGILPRVQSEGPIVDEAGRAVPPGVRSALLIFLQPALFVRTPARR